MVEFSSSVLRVFIMTINNKSERNYRGKCLGWPVTSYSADKTGGWGGSHGHPRTSLSMPLECPLRC